MLYRILVVCVLVLAFTMPVVATTIHQVMESPQFTKVHSREFPRVRGVFEGADLVYVNLYSVEPIEYAPPHYKIKGQYAVVRVTPEGQYFREYTMVATYDTNYSLANLLHAQGTLTPTPSMLAVMKAGRENGGITVDITGGQGYRYDGVPISSERPMVQKYSVAIDRSRQHQDLYAVADALFLAAYNQHFDDIVNP